MQMFSLMKIQNFTKCKNKWKYNISFQPIFLSTAILFTIWSKIVKSTQKFACPLVLCSKDVVLFWKHYAGLYYIHLQNSNECTLLIQTMLRPKWAIRFIWGHIICFAFFLFSISILHSSLYHCRYFFDNLKCACN